MQAILVYSGSFNPIHLGHIEVMKTIKKVMEENHGFTILKVYIAPSSDAYVRSKLGKSAMSLTERIAVCELAIEDHKQWMEVCPYGIMSGSQTANKIRKDHKIHQNIKIFEIGGADYALRCQPWRGQTYKNFICIGRKGSTEEILELIQECKSADKLNPNFYLIDEEVADVSSTMIRKYLESTEPHKAVELGLIDQSVYDYLVGT